MSQWTHVTGCIRVDGIFYGTNALLGVVPEWKLRQEHDEEIKRVMEETGCTFHKWHGKAFWELAKEYGHTSLDFDKCECKRHYA